MCYWAILSKSPFFNLELRLTQASGARSLGRQYNLLLQLKNLWASSEEGKSPSLRDIVEFDINAT